MMMLMVRDMDNIEKDGGVNDGGFDDGNDG